MAVGDQSTFTDPVILVGAFVSKHQTCLKTTTAFVFIFAIYVLCFNLFSAASKISDISSDLLTI